MPVVHLDVTNFKEIITKNRVVVVDFWDDWCPPCLMMDPYFKKLAEKYAGKAVFGKVKVGENPLLAQAFEIEAIPTVIIFKNGKPFKKLVGFGGPARLEQAIRSAIES